jgi:ABC-type transport system involved in multi-copper enzyme maturation permease subunit
MDTLRRIWAVARAERRLLRRSWLFWILVVLATLGVLLDMLGKGVQYFLYAGLSGSMAILSPNLPVFSMAMMEGMVLCLVLVWLIFNHVHRDRKHRVEGVLHASPVRTWELLVGRVIGIVIPILILMTILRTITYVTYGIGAGAWGLWSAHLFYLVAGTIPTVITLVTFTLAVLSLTRSRIVTIVLCWPLPLASFIWIVASSKLLPYWARPLADIVGLSSALLPSDMIGFTDEHLAALHKGYVLFLSLMMISLAVWRFPRLRGRAGTAWRPLATAGVGLVLAVVLGGAFALEMLSYETTRDDARAEQEALAAAPRGALQHMDLKLDLRRWGGKFGGDASLRMRNDNDAPVASWHFVLNAGLEIDEVTDGSGSPLEHERGRTVLTVSTPPVAPGETTVVRIAYGGDPIEQGLYPASSSEFWDLEGQEVGTTILSLGYLSTHLGDYAFLMPASRFYPSPNMDYGYEYPDRRPPDFFTARIEVDTREGWKIATQGEPVEERESDGGTLHVWESEVPVPRLAVIAGPYEVVEGTFEEPVDEGEELGEGEERQVLHASLYHHPGHRRNLEYFGEIEGRIRERIGEELEKVRERTGLYYPYPSLRIVEVPAPLRGYGDGFDPRNELVQPGLVLLRENGFFQANFETSAWSLKQIRKRAGRDTSDEALKMALIEGYFQNDFTGGSIVHNAIPNFWDFQLEPIGELYPLLERSLPSYVAELATGNRPFFSVYSGRRLNQVLQGSIQSVATGRGDAADRAVQGAIEEDKARKAMQEAPFTEMDPYEDPLLYLGVMEIKGRAFIRGVEHSVGKEGFADALNEVLAENRHDSYGISELRGAIETEAGEEMPWLFDGWLRETVLPGIIVPKHEAYRIASDDPEPRYQVIVRIRNGEEGQGLCALELTTAGDTLNEVIELPGGVEKEWAVVVPGQPEGLVVDGLLAKNREPIRRQFPKELPEKRERPITGTREVEPTLEKLGIVVDDLDEGFRIEGEEARSWFRPKVSAEVETFRRPWGVPRTWHIWHNRAGFGAYDPAVHFRKPGEGTTSAVWEAEIPEAGDYEVLAYIGLRSTDLKVWPQRKLGTYTYTVHTADGPEEVTVEADGTERGWNTLGTWYFEEGTARVELSDDVEDGTLVADAIRWTRNGGES